MLDFNAMINEAIKAAITSAVNEALTKQAGLILQLETRLEQLESKIETDLVSRQEVADLAEEAAQTFMDNHSNDDLLQSPDFDQAVREVIRGCL